MRMSGFTLIGVGLLALVFGVSSVFAGESETVAEQSTAVTTTDRRTESDSAPAEDSATARTTEGEASSAPETTTSDTEPPRRVTSETPTGTTSPRREAGGEHENGPERIALRVYNNSKIDGLAHRAADDLRGAGFDVVEVGNYGGGRIPVTTVYYRPGTEERAQAETVARKLDARVEPRFRGIADASPGVIVIVTKYYDGLD
ncbi:hypothetical protein CEP50_09605 [Actinopolyspora mortivallis]|uniref:LytR/CpsA/Psr regulator C-terminal domain-containing protein n=2 Tax=Actinopolyspora mortivallis TaxID=33906 RepID=A0A2T0GWX8_ACTMO|nr:hypothetical protein CEP50_09605 [Actinopolyspora mortivallis]